MTDSKEELQQHAGQVLTIGFEGHEADAVTRLLAEVRPGGVIFFQRNLVAEEQFESLVAGVRRILDDPQLLLAVDLEGGLVDRFRELIAPLPSFRDAARAGAARRLGQLAGRELAAFSLNVDFAPVLDLSTADSAAVLASRTASQQPQCVLEFAGEFLSGLAEHHVLGCGKHFPGLGSGRQDSHLRMPSIEKTEEALWREDLLPFRGLAGRLPMIMVAHAWYPALERALQGGTGQQEERVPASLSPRIITGVLRRRIGYQGVVICDDLEMGGALEGRGESRSIGEAAVAAIRAGCDMLLVCRKAENVQETFAALVRQAEQDSMFHEALARAARRISALKRLLPPVAAPQQSAPLQQLREEIEKLTAEIHSRLASQPPAIQRFCS